jgi:hypothetical protein
MKRLFLAFTLLALAIGMAGGITSCNNRQPDALRDQSQESAKEQDETPGCEDIAGLYALTCLTPESCTRQIFPDFGCWRWGDPLGSAPTSWRGN